MSDRRRWVGQGRAVAASFSIAFLALCLVGYDPADPPGHAVVPAQNPPTNLCGPVGATLAHALMTAVGRGVIRDPVCFDRLGTIAGPTPEARRTGASSGWGPRPGNPGRVGPDPEGSTRRVGRAPPWGPGDTSARRPWPSSKGSSARRDAPDPGGVRTSSAWPLPDDPPVWPIQEASGLIRSLRAARLPLRTAPVPGAGWP